MFSCEPKVAQKSIAEMFARQVTYGEQSVGLLPQAAACGQFLERTEVSHRGLHGTAAALRVLAQEGQSNVEFEKVVQELLTFVEATVLQKDCQTLCMSEQEERRHVIHRGNVIKLSEVLYALTFVRDNESNVLEKRAHAIAHQIAIALQEGMKEGRAWSYFLDDLKAPELLPTAYALRAMATYSDSSIKTKRLAACTKYVSDHFTSDKLLLQTDTAVQSLCLFVMAYLPRSCDPPRLATQKAWFKRLWRQLEPLLAQDSESSYDYPYDDRYYYIRVPWQLYLIGAANKLAPSRFYSLAARHKLNAVTIAAASPEGFSYPSTYPGSGKGVPSRTAGIVYDLLDVLKKGPRPRAAYVMWRLRDGVRVIVGSRWFTYFANLGAFAIAAIAIVRWASSRDASLSDLGPSFVIAAITLVLANRRKLN